MRLCTWYSHHAELGVISHGAINVRIVFVVLPLAHSKVDQKLSWQIDRTMEEAYSREAVLAANLFMSY